MKLLSPPPRLRTRRAILGSPLGSAAVVATRAKSPRHLYRLDGPYWMFSFIRKASNFPGTRSALGWPLARGRWQTTWEISQLVRHALKSTRRIAHAASFDGYGRPLHRRAGRYRLQCHAALWAVSWPVLSNLWMHGTRVLHGGRRSSICVGPVHQLWPGR